MFKCMHCGSEFEEPNKTYDHGTGRYDYECPCCASEDFEEAGKCIKCGEVFPLDDMIGSICRGCVEKRATVSNAYRWGWRHTPEGKLNDFVNYAWTPSLASEELLKHCTPEDARQYVSNDLYDFSEWLEGQDD